MFFNTRAKKEQAELKRLLAEMQSEKQQLRDHWTARFSEVDSKNAILDQARSRLENLLKESLLVDTCIIFDSLKIQARLPEFKRKEPILQLPAPPSGLASWLPWKNRSYEKACASAERKYQKDLEVYREASFNHKKRVSQIRAEAEKHNQDIERFLQDFVAGEAGAVVRYFKLVLKNSEYLPGFSKKAELAYFPESRLLKISYDLPAMDIIPETEAYKYAKSRDEIAGIVLPQKQRRQFYASVLAQTSLRTIYEIFTADRTEKIEHIVFEGYVDATNPSTGQPGRFCLIALDVQREHFLDLNLKQVEPVACLKGLNARVSSKPDLLLSVSSSSGEERDDAQGPAVSDADMLQALNIRIGELDDEIQEQKQRNAELENELSDKRDRIAELIRDLREEQERSAMLSAAIHAQKDDTVELRAGASEETGDVLPAEARTEIEEESAITEAAIFAPIDSGSSEDEPGGARIPSCKAEADKPVALSDLLRATTKPPKVREAAHTVRRVERQDIHELVHCINWLGEAEAKLLALLKRSDWECSEESVQSAFRERRFIRPIIHNINDPIYEVIGENLIEEDGDSLVIDEEYRDALEQALKLTDNQYIEYGRGRR